MKVLEVIDEMLAQGAIDQRTADAWRRRWVERGAEDEEEEDDGEA